MFQAGVQNILWLETSLSSGTSCGLQVINRILDGWQKLCNIPDSGLKNLRDLQIRGALGRALVSHRNRDYWWEARKIRGKKKSNSAVVNGHTESKDIANEFANKHSLLYNSVTSDPDELYALAYSTDDGIYNHHACMITVHLLWRVC